MNSTGKQERYLVPPPGFDPEIARWIWALEDTRRRTKGTLSGLPAPALNWSPDEGGNTIGMLLYHLVAVEMSYVYEDVLLIEWAPELEPLLPYDIRDEQGLLSKVREESLDDHLTRLDAARRLTLQAYRNMTLEEFRRPREVADAVITSEWVLHHLMQHEAEHRGQIGEIRLKAEAA